MHRFGDACMLNLSLAPQIIFSIYGPDVEFTIIMLGDMQKGMIVAEK